MKLNKYGVRGIALKWFNSYLSNRKQYTEIKKCKSQEKVLEYGVPQGSVLGPLLFLILINDLNRCLKHTGCIIYADDTTLYVTGENIDENFRKMNFDLEILQKWFMSNKLSLNVDKTIYVVFKPKNKIFDRDLNYLVLDNNVLKCTDQCKFLGIWLDQHLSWKYHIEKLCNKLNSSLYMLNQVKYILPTHILRILFNSYMQSHLYYGLSLWGPMCLSSDSKRICILHKKAIRSISKSASNSSAKPLYKRNNILMLPDLIDLETLKLMYRCVNDNLPREIKLLFNNTVTDERRYNTRNRNVPIMNRHRTNIYNKSFLCQSIMKWNLLPHEIKTSINMSNFCKKYIKQKLSTY
jgi:hypothetical protein